MNPADKKGLATDAGNVMYTLTLQFKEGRYRYELTDFNWKQQSYYACERWMDKTKASYEPKFDYYLQQVNSTAGEVLKSLEISISTAPSAKLTIGNQATFLQVTCSCKTSSSGFSPCKLTNPGFIPGFILPKRLATPRNSAPFSVDHLTNDAKGTIGKFLLIILSSLRTESFRFDARLSVPIVTCALFLKSASTGGRSPVMNKFAEGQRHHDNLGLVSRMKQFFYRIGIVHQLQPIGTRNQGKNLTQRAYIPKRNKIGSRNSSRREKFG